MTDARKKLARYLLHAAMRKGQMHRPPDCSRCHQTCKPHGHHGDYNKPLDVVWLCSTCHGLAHTSAVGSLLTMAVVISRATHTKLRQRALKEKCKLKDLTERLLMEALARKATA